MRQVHALEHEMNGRERLHHDPAGAQFGLDLGERDAGPGTGRRWPPIRSGLTEPVSRSRRMSFTAAEGLTS